MIPRRASLALGLAVLVLCLAAPAWAAATSPTRPYRDHQVYFANTPNELNVYRVYGAQDGKTLLIIGGIQGDEPGGFLSADLYADMTLAKGNLIVVPRANFYSIILNHRGPDGDMNRQFGDPITARRHRAIIDILKKLISQSDCLLNLHDGSGFYRPQWEGPMANPQRYGQSLIADTDRYKRPDGSEVDLAAMAERVLSQVNPKITNPKYRILFNNHRTARSDSQHKEQRLSATYYALSRHHIPAFGVETSKSLPNTAMKIRHHNLVINGFMAELGIVPENPGSILAPPSFEFLVASVNGQLPVVVFRDGALTVRPGDLVNILHIESNYERGLTCDVVGGGSVNDLRQEIAVHGPTTVVVRKDNQKIGSVRINVAADEASYTSIRSPILYFLLEVEGERRVVAAQETLKVVQGDRLRLVDILSNLPSQGNLQVNFKGYVPPAKGPNPGEDRGYVINTATDLMARYSQCPPGAKDVSCFRVEATQGEKLVGRMMVEVKPARLDYVVLKRRGGDKVAFNNGETIQARRGESLEIIDVKTNAGSPRHLALALESKGRHVALTNGKININADLLKRLTRPGRGDEREIKLVVLRADQAIGHLQLQIGGQ